MRPKNDKGRQLYGQAELSDAADIVARGRAGAGIDRSTVARGARRTVGAGQPQARIIDVTPAPARLTEAVAFAVVYEGLVFAEENPAKRAAAIRCCYFRQLAEFLRLDDRTSVTAGLTRFGGRFVAKVVWVSLSICLS